MLRAVGSFWNRQVSEVEQDPALRIYGAALAMLQVLSAIYWLRSGVAGFLAQGAEAVCWPFWPACESWHVLDERAVRVGIALFLLSGLGVTLAFLWPSARSARSRPIAFAFVGLAALNIAKLAILCLDFRLRMNHHIMAFWVTLIFLLIPGKRRALKWQIVFFYFWAGLLKLNSEWLSGSALYGQLWLIHGQAVAWACAYVVALEILGVWGILVSDRRVAWAVWFLLMLFHLFSFPIVGFFYPLLMAAILSVFPLCWLIERPREATAGFRASLLPTCAVLAAFSLSQVQAKAMPGDTAVTGEGRVFALHMFDSWTHCESQALLKDTGEPPVTVNLRIPLPIRLHCDPIVYLSRARRLCRLRREADPKFADLDLTLRTRRSDYQNFRTVVDIADFCSKDVGYSFISHNRWIHTD